MKQQLLPVHPHQIKCLKTFEIMNFLILKVHRLLFFNNHYIKLYLFFKLTWTEKTGHSIFFQIFGVMRTFFWNVIVRGQIEMNSTYN